MAYIAKDKANAEHLMILMHFKKETNRDVLKAVKKNLRLVSVVPDKYKEYFDITASIIKNEEKMDDIDNAKAKANVEHLLILLHFGNETKKDVVKALEKNWRLLILLPDKHKADYDVLLAAMKTKKNAFLLIHKKFFRDEDYVANIALVNPNILDYVPKNIRLAIEKEFEECGQLHQLNRKIINGWGCKIRNSDGYYYRIL